MHRLVLKEVEILLAPKKVWDKPRPKGLGKPTTLSKKQKKRAMDMARKSGRPYPNLVDNMRAAQK